MKVVLNKRKLFHRVEIDRKLKKEKDVEKSSLILLHYFIDIKLFAESCKNKFLHLFLTIQAIFNVTAEIIMLNDQIFQSHLFRCFES